jgi:hypothetical protein
MTRISRNIGLATLIAGGVAVMPATAAALTVVSPPFGDAPVVAVVGNLSGVLQVVWSRMSDGACFFQALGNSTGPFDSYNINGSSGNDVMDVVHGSTIICGVTVGPPSLGGFFLDLHGMGGNDLMFTGPSDTWLWGGGGHDQLYSANTNASFSGQSLFGGPDNDCLDINRPLVPASPAAYDCGPGNDVDLNSPPNNINCERPAIACSCSSTGCVPSE